MADIPSEPAPDISLDTAGQAAQALASRICHDLVSPIGAIANGVDLLRELGGTSDGTEIEMIGQSAQRAADVLAFHRLAFGAAASDSAEIARAQLAKIVTAMLAGPRIVVAVAGHEGPALSRLAARATALSALAMRGLLAMRGRLAIDLGTGGLPIAVTAEGADRIRRGEAFARLEAAVAGPTAMTLDPREIEFDFLPGAARAAGAVLSLSESDDRVSLSLAPT